MTAATNDADPSGDGEPGKPWTLAAALTTVRAVESMVRPLGLFTAMTGGVLYRGESAKDLDIGFAQLGEQRVDWPLKELRRSLGLLGWRIVKSVDEVYAYRREKGLLSPGVVRNEVECWLDAEGRRIDVFIWRDARVAPPIEEVF